LWVDLPLRATPFHPFPQTVEKASLKSSPPPPPQMKGCCPFPPLPPPWEEGISQEGRKEGFPDCAQTPSRLLFRQRSRSSSSREPFRPLPTNKTGSSYFFFETRFPPGEIGGPSFPLPGKGKGFSMLSSVQRDGSSTNEVSTPFPFGRNQIKNLPRWSPTPDPPFFPPIKKRALFSPSPPIRGFTP